MERGSAPGTGVNGLLQHRLSIAGARSCRREDARPAEEGPCRENREGRPANIRLRQQFETTSNLMIRPGLANSEPTIDMSLWATRGARTRENSGPGTACPPRPRRSRSSDGATVRGKTHMQAKCRLRIGRTSVFMRIIEHSMRYPSSLLSALPQLLFAAG